MYRILISDDEQEICKLIKTFLERKGFEVIVTDSAEEGLYLLSKEKSDLLIQDKKMPGIGGFGVLRELRARNDNIPVIILTGHLDKIDAATEEVIKLGYVDLLLKPVDLNLLLNKINKRLKIEKEEEEGK